jgi:hypothetical protein
VGLFISIVIYEIRFRAAKLEMEIEGNAIPICQFYNGVCTTMLIASIYIRYDTWLQWSVTVGKYTKFDNLINTGLWKEMLLEMIINGIAPMPFLDGVKYIEYVAAFEYEIEQEVNDVLLLF